MCDCLKRTGDVITEDREVSFFTSVYVEDNVNVVFTEDPTVTHVTVEGGENILPLIRTEVVDGELRIRNDNKCNFTRRYNIPVTVYIQATPDLKRITTIGTALVSNTGTCTADSLELVVKSSGDIDFTVNAVYTSIHEQSAGDITLHGQSHDVIIYILGAGFVTTDECASAYNWVYTKGTGRITVAGTDLLIAYVEGYGSIYYRNQPTLLTSITGTGGVFPL